MESTICTIGFAGKTAEQFFRLLTEAGVKKVIDIRENRTGQLSGYAKWPDLEFFLRRVAEIDYLYEPRLAPSPETRDAYYETKNWPAYESAFLNLMRERDIPQSLNLSLYMESVALLCSEPQPEKCHRKIVAELVREECSRSGSVVRVRHLSVDTRHSSVQKRKKVSTSKIAND